MMKLFANIIITLVLLLSVVVVVSATPTTSIKEDSSKWPLFYLQRDTSSNTLSVVQTEITNNKHIVTLATARVSHSALTKGFNFLSTNTSTPYFRQQQSMLDEFYAHGYLEGYLTFSEMKNANVTGSWATMLEGTVPQVGEWFENQTTWMKKQVEENENKKNNNEKDPFWTKVGHLFQQMQGIADGYSAFAKTKQSSSKEEESTTGAVLTWKQVFASNILGTGEVGGVEWHFGEYGLDASEGKDAKNNYFFSSTAKLKTTFPKAYDRLKRLQWKSSSSPSMMLGAQGHCSALVRVVDEDLFSSHTTWASFEMCNNRIFKSYEFSDGFWFSMSSYPTQISSLDDWYLTKNLWVAETTMWTFNQSLYKDYPFETVSEFLRVMVANHLGTSGKTWKDLFGTKNNGGYDNSYMVLTKSNIVNKSILTSSVPAKLPPDTLWVVEQVPHYVVGGDVTDILNQQGYWGSWNAAYWPEIRALAGYDRMEEKYGPGYWSLTNYSRAKIFARDAPKVTNIQDMQKIMRYNNYKKDPASLILNCSGTKPVDNKCDPPYSSQNAIGNRADLMPPNLDTDQLGPLATYLAQADHTATDAKIARFSSWDTNNRRALIISGPPVDLEHDIPPFVFSKSNLFNYKKPENLVGVPDEINFEWMDVNLVDGHETDNNNNGNSSDVVGIVFAIVGALTLLYTVFAYIRFRKEEKLEKEQDEEEKRKLMNENNNNYVQQQEEDASRYGTNTSVV